jgi:hypothetical protein
MLDNVIVPDTRTTAALDDCTAELKAAAVVTVTGLALPPPDVPPPWVAQPTSAGAAAADGTNNAMPTNAELMSAAALLIFSCIPLSH